MKVLHVQKVTGIGGSERHLLELLSGLRAAGINVEMCVIGGGDFGRFTTVLEEREVPFTVVRAGRHIDPFLIFRLRRVIRRLRPDLVHTHLVHADVYGQLSAFISRVPGISSFHSTNPFFTKEPYRSLTSLVERLACRTVAISEHVRSFLLAHRLSRPETTTVIHYGIDPERLRPRSDPSGSRVAFGCDDRDFVVGVASRLFPNKGQDVVISAFAEVARREKRARLLIAGDGPLRGSLEHLAGTSSDHISFLGHVDDVGLFMSMCDVLVFPTQPGFGEGFGLAALEAMACGTPVVASDIDSLPEVIEDGVTGQLFPPQDTKALSAILLRLATSPKLLKSMSRAAVERVEKNFHVGRMVSQTISEYEWVVGHGRRSKRSQ